MSLTASLSPLREGSFARYFAAVGISALGTFAATIALSFGVLEIAGPADLGLVLLSREIPIVVLVLAGGVFADRLPRRLLLVATNSVQAVTQLAAAVLLIRGSASVIALAVIATLNGAANGFSRPATTGLVPHIVSRDRLQAANGLLGITPRVVGIAGTALGAGLIQAVGPGWALALDSVTYLAAAGLIWSVAGTTERAKRSASPLADLAEGWAAVRSRPWVWRMILSFGPFQLAYFPAVLVLGPVVARDSLGGSGAWAAIISASLVGGLIGGLMAGTVRPKHPLVVICLAPLGNLVELVGLSAAWPLPAIVTLAAIGGVGLTMADTLWITVLQRHIPDDLLSRVSSFDWLGSMVLNPLGYAVIGPLAALIGAPEALALAALLLTAATLVPLTSAAVRGLVEESTAENADPKST